MKVALLADLHFGVKRGDQIWMDSQVRFFEKQLVPELKSKNITDIWILGDVFDTRESVNVNVIGTVIHVFKDILRDFNVTCIVGNHDMYLKTSTEIHSLKILQLLPNVTVYEKRAEMTVDGKSILLLPWITDYSEPLGLKKKYDYCLSHLDIIGYDMGSGRLSDNGIYANELLKNIKHVYAGHYHEGVFRTYEGGKSICYIGAPYQITRNDYNRPRGYRILDVGTEKDEFVQNHESIIFTKHTYPDDVDESVISGNVVDMDVPIELADKKFNAYIEKLEKMNPAYPVNVNVLVNESEELDIIDTDNLNIITLFNEFIKTHDTEVDKDKLTTAFMDLYNQYKED